jgi:hypothetical protein
MVLPLAPEISFGIFVREHHINLGLTQAVISIRVGCVTIIIRKIEADSSRHSDDHRTPGDGTVNSLEDEANFQLDHDENACLVDFGIATPLLEQSRTRIRSFHNG